MSRGLEKPLATGTNSTCRVGGGGGGGGVVIEPPLHPKHASVTHQTRTALRRILEERLSCMIPPQPDFSILPKGMTLRRVILRYDLSTILGRAASKSVLWQNRKFIELILWHTVQPWKKSDPQKRRSRPRSQQLAVPRNQPATTNASAFLRPSAAGAIWKRRSIPSACSAP